MAQASSRSEPLLDFATDVAKAANMLLQIDGSTLRVINRIQTGAVYQTVRNPELLGLSVNPAYPIKKVYSEFEYNTPYPDSVTLATERKVVQVENLSYGEEQNMKHFRRVKKRCFNFSERS